MSFTSLGFVPFFLAVMLLFYLLPGRWQKITLLVANYVFYMWWEPRFGLLLLAGTAVSYLAARCIDRSLGRRRKLSLWLGLGFLLGTLLVFKYADFLLSGIFALFGRADVPTLQLLLPIGISFYTFSAAGYLIDVYRGVLVPEEDALDYAVFLSFFPSLLSGPISRARELLPQLKSHHTICPAQFREGLLRFVWGLAKKLLVVESLAIIVNTTYAAPETFPGVQILFAALVFSLQIYFDFSAYSDMSIGTARMLGFTLMENFDSPYFSISIRDFWKKWHISLTSWFREYLYFPLGGSRKGTVRTYLNILIVFVISGLWHGAAITFAIWGLLNGIYQVIGQITIPLRKRLWHILRLSEHGLFLTLIRTLCVFMLMTVSWVFFRADTLEQAVYILRHIALVFRYGPDVLPIVAPGLHPLQFNLLPLFMLPFIIVDLMRALHRPAMPRIVNRPWLYCGALALLLSVTFLFGMYGEGYNASEFVYFQF